MGGVTNLLDRNTFEINKRFSGGTTEVAANGYYISNYIPVDITKSPVAVFEGSFSAASSATTNDKIAFYDANKAALGFAYIYTSKVNSGTNPVTLFTASDNSKYTNNLGYIWTGTDDITKASYYDQIAYVKINQKISDSALESVNDIPLYKFYI